LYDVFILLFCLNLLHIADGCIPPHFMQECLCKPLVLKFSNRVFVIRAYIDFLISTFLSNSHSKFPTIWTILFQFSITFNNSFLPFQLPYPSIFATCYPFPEIFTSFPFPPNRANSPFYPSVRSSSPTYFTSIFISNSAFGLVYPSTLSDEVLCDAPRLV
jgi:hypothetical protein